MPHLRYAQLRYLSLILTTWLAVFFLTRSALLIGHLGDANSGVVQLFGIYGIGVMYDVAFLLYAALPLTLYLVLCPRRLWEHPWHNGFMHTLLAISLFAMLFTAVAEWLFWDEFGVRFNFISVDYLVYSDEVINNILESYPIYPLLAFLALIAVVGTVLLRKATDAALQAPLLRWRDTWTTLAASSDFMDWVAAGGHIVRCRCHYFGRGSGFSPRHRRQRLSTGVGEQRSVSILRGVSQQRAGIPAVLRDAAQTGGGRSASAGGQ